MSKGREIALNRARRLLRCLRRALYSFDPSTGKSAAAGEQRLEPHGGSQIALPTSDGGVLLIGGSLGVRKKGDPPLQPQIWRAGKITSLAGAEKDLEAQAKLQRRG